LWKGLANHAQGRDGSEDQHEYHHDVDEDGIAYKDREKSLHESEAPSPATSTSMVGNGLTRRVVITASPGFKPPRTKVSSPSCRSTSTSWIAKRLSFARNTFPS